MTSSSICGIEEHPVGLRCVLGTLDRSELDWTFPKHLWYQPEICSILRRRRRKEGEDLRTFSLTRGNIGGNSGSPLSTAFAFRSSQVAFAFTISSSTFFFKYLLTSIRSCRSNPSSSAASWRYTSSNSNGRTVRSGIGSKWNCLPRIWRKATCLWIRNQSKWRVTI